MAKKVAKKIKVQVPAGKANPAPPLGPALGAAGVNIQEFCTQFNDRTKDMGGDNVTAVITVYDDRSFSFEVKSPPAAFLIKKAINLKSGSAKPHLDKVGKISRKQLEEIYEIKKADLNANDVDAGVQILAGTCRAMGIRVEK
jgi:large subunit ribosomal protein L11